MSCVVGSCGANQPRATTPIAASDVVTTTASGAMPAGAVLPATSIATTPVRDDGLLASLHPVRVTEPCPTSTSTPNGSQQSLAVSTALESVLGQVLAYGGEHVDEFGGYGLVWDGPRHAAVFAAFASDLSPHRAALATIVSDPKGPRKNYLSTSGGRERCGAALTDVGEDRVVPSQALRT